MSHSLQQGLFRKRDTVEAVLRSRNSAKAEGLSNNKVIKCCSIQSTLAH